MVSSIYGLTHSPSGCNFGVVFTICLHSETCTAEGDFTTDNSTINTMNALMSPVSSTSACYHIQLLYINSKWWLEFLDDLDLLCGRQQLQSGRHLQEDESV